MPPKCRRIHLRRRRRRRRRARRGTFPPLTHLPTGSRRSQRGWPPAIRLHRPPSTVYNRWRRRCTPRQLKHSRRILRHGRQRPMDLVPIQLCRPRPDERIQRWVTTPFRRRARRRRPSHGAGCNGSPLPNRAPRPLPGILRGRPRTRPGSGDIRRRVRHDRRVRRGVVTRRRRVEHGPFQDRFIRRGVLGGDGEADAEPFPAEAQDDDGGGRGEDKSAEDAADDDAGYGAAA